MISPILCYNSEIWGYEYCDDIEYMSNSVKNILRLNSCDTISPAVFGEVGDKGMLL
jgi:hypothetical protein